MDPRASRRPLLIYAFASIALYAASLVATAAAQSGTGAAHNDDRVLQDAMQAMDRGDLSTAGLLLKRLNTVHPRNFAVEESLGEVAAAENDWKSSAHWLELAARDQPSAGAQVFANLGTAYWKSGQPQAALRALQRSERIDPNNAQTQALLGSVEETLGHFDLAARHLLRAAEIDPTEDRWNDAGTEFLRHWSFDPAERVFRGALVRFPGSARLRFGLAVALYGAQHYEEAVPVLAQLVREQTSTQPEQRNSVLLFGRSCAALSAGDAPLCAEFVSYAERPDTDPELSVLAATWLMRRGGDVQSEHRAEALLQSALQRKPALAEGQYQMGLLQQHKSDWAASIPYLREAIRLKPDYTQAHYRLGLALSHTGQRQQASAEMQTEQQLADAEKASLDQRLNEIQTIVVNGR